MNFGSWWMPPRWGLPPFRPFSSGSTAERQQHLWPKMKRKPRDEADSLPSLMWLTDYTVKDTGMPRLPGCPSSPDLQDTTPSFAAPCSPLAGDPACMGSPHAPCKPISSSTSKTTHHTVTTPPPLAEDIDYKINPYVKPPYSYANLICMAMEASGEPKITLSAIYKWITDNFCYYRHADPTWQNSIRHNLSLNKCFIKVPREKGEPGKGGFWKLDPQYADRLKNGAFKKRRMAPVRINPAFTQKGRQEAPRVASPAASASASRNIVSISAESERLLKELEEATSGQTLNPVDGKAGQKRKQPLPDLPAKVLRPSDPALLSQEEQSELGSLKGDFDWEAIFNTNLNGDFSSFGHLELVSPVSPTTPDPDSTVHGHHIDLPQGEGQGEEQEQVQVQVLAEPSQEDLDLDETFKATSLLQHSWEEETNDSLSNCINIEQLFDFHDTPLPAHGGDWSDLANLL